MSSLLSALDEVASVVIEDLTVEELRDLSIELSLSRDRIDVVQAQVTRKMSDIGGHLTLGYPSPTAFLAHQVRMSYGHARQITVRANAKDRAPAAFKAWEDGRLSTDQASQLFRAAETVPDAYPEGEQTLLDIVEGLSVADTAKAVEYWLQSVHGPGDTDLEHS